MGATYFATPDSSVADTEQYTFGGQRMRLLVEVDCDSDGRADADSGWHEIYGEKSAIDVSRLRGARWRARLRLTAPEHADRPTVRGLHFGP